ncbi:hypothetical protein D3C72_1345480 [compost metagenome]
MHQRLEAVAVRLHLDAGAREGIVHGAVERLAVADLADGLQGRGQIGPIVRQHRRVSAQLRLACGRLGVRAEVVVEAPGAHLLAQREHLGRVTRVGVLGHHAGEGRDRPADGLPALAVTQAQRGALAVDQVRGGAQQRAAPDRLVLDLRVVREGRGRDGRRQADVDGVAEIVGLGAGEAQLQRHRLAAHGALHRLLAAQHRRRKALGPGPQRGRQPALAHQRADHAAVGDVGQQPHRAVHARLAAAVGARDHREAAQRHRQLAQRTVVGNGERGEHAPLRQRRQAPASSSARAWAAAKSRSPE